MTKNKSFRYWSIGVVISILVIRFVCYYVLGVTPKIYEFFNQYLPFDLLRDRPFESIWYLHMQPPFYNLLLSVLIKIFGIAGLEISHIILNIILTIFSSVALLYICYYFLKSYALSILIVVISFVLNPAAIVWESLVFYDTLTVSLLIFAFYFLCRYTENQKTLYLALSSVTLSILVLTRSMFLFLFPIILFALYFFLESRRPNIRITAGKSVVLCAIILLSLLPVFGLMAKNVVNFGFFGTASQGGCVLWEAANYAGLNEIYNPGQLNERTLRLAAYNPYATPVQKLIEQGFTDRTSMVPVLDRVSTIPLLISDGTPSYKDSKRLISNYNNLNMLDVCDAAGKLGMSSIRHNLPEYARLYFRQAYNFFKPSTRPSMFIRIEENVRKIDLLDRVYRKALVPFSDIHILGLLFIPAVLLAAYGIIASLKRERFRVLADKQYTNWLGSANWPIFGCIIFSIIYLLMITAVGQVGDQSRYKYYVEALIFLSIAYTAKVIVGMLKLTWLRLCDS